jgi:hypothetical protein
VPHDERTGAIVKGEHGLPVRAAAMRQLVPRDRRAAGIPDEVWNMDARAGGATEADEAGARSKMIQGALTHTKERTTLRYLGAAPRRSPRIAGSAQPSARTRKCGGTG